MTRSRFITIVLVFGALVAIFLCVKWGPKVREQVGDEPYKFFLQFSLITVVGGLVSTVFAELKREEELRETRRESVREFHGRALSAYNRAKRCRRLLPVEAFTGDPERPSVRVAEYRAAMTELEDVQLEFESMKREVAVAKNIFSHAENLQQSLSSMERYLRLVLLEFEAAKFSPSDAEISISALPKLWAFIGDQFIVSFSVPYDEVEAVFLRLILR
jgi:hypothetical protein